MTNEERLSIFRKQVDIWMSKLNMDDYRYEIDSAPDDDIYTSAWCKMNASGRIACFYLNSNKRSNESSADIGRAALHEVLELLLYEYIERVLEKGKDDDAARHTVIRRLECIL